MTKPFVFTPPPLINDITTTTYRESLGGTMGPITDHYRIFNREFDLNTGAPLAGDGPDRINHQLYIRKEEALKIKVYNLKFLIYTLYSSMIDFFSVFKN